VRLLSDISGEQTLFEISGIQIKYWDRYTTYGSRDHASWPPSMAEIVSKAIVA
jgi:hypothetical protein